MLIVFCSFLCFTEPGYYEDGVFGIRLETVVVAVPAKTEVSINDGSLKIGKFVFFARVFARRQ